MGRGAAVGTRGNGARRREGCIEWPAQFEARKEGGEKPGISQKTGTGRRPAASNGRGIGARTTA